MENKFNHDDIEIPEKFRAHLGNYGPQLFDSGCGEPVAWGYKIYSHLGEELWGEIQRYGAPECLEPGKWVLVTRYLTHEEAIQKYGAVTEEERGPRGGFRSITFGKKKFLSRRLAAK